MAITKIDESQFYKLGNYQGTIREKLKNFSRNQFTPTNTTHIDISKISTEKKTLSQLAIMAPKFGGQGFQRCNYKQGCKTNKCKCKRSGLKCNTEFVFFLYLLHFDCLIFKYYIYKLTISKNYLIIKLW